VNPFPYQITGRDFLVANDRAYLGDGMGLGKTVQAAIAAKHAGIRRVLTVCPASATENWKREWKEWGEGKPAVLSYASPLLHRIRLQGDELVILDEAHYVKTESAKRTKLALVLAKLADRAWLLSGTPMPNHPGELYAPIAALWPEIPRELGIRNHWEWFNRFCFWTRTRYGPRPYAIKNAGQLKPHLQKIMLRRELKDVDLELPPITVHFHLLPRDRGFAAALQAAGVDPDDLSARMDAEEGEEGSSSRLRRLLGSYKAPLIGDLIAREMDDKAYPKIVLGYHHKGVREILEQKLRPFGVTGIDGSVPSGPKRQARIDQFWEDPDTRVFLGQMQADDNAQFIKRIHRPGQRHDCRARIFGVAGSLDEPIMGSVIKKTRYKIELGLKGGAA
jgi:SNF2 family DNA or RNA helicase